MKPPSQGGRGCRLAKLALIVSLGLFTIAQGVLPGQTEDMDRNQGRCPSILAVASGPTDDPKPLPDHMDTYQYPTSSSTHAAM